MAASGLGLPSASRLATCSDGAPTSSLSSSSSSAARLCFTHPSYTKKTIPIILSLSASNAGSSGAGSALFTTRCSHETRVEVAEAPYPPSEESSPPPLSSEAKPPMEDAGTATIELEFLAVDQGQDGLPIVDRVSVKSGEKLLRSIMNEQKLELYGLYGKIMNCGGGGSCGTCTVEVLEGSHLLNERTDAEERYLKKKPSTWRLACQTIVGDKTNSGKVLVQRLPQRKK